MPAAIRQPLRNAVKGPPPSPEELEARRKAALELRAARERRKHSRVRARERGAWIKQEATTGKRVDADLERQAAAAELRSRKAALERQKRSRHEAREREAWVKQELSAGKRRDADLERRQAAAERRSRKAADRRQKESRAGAKDRWLIRDGGEDFGRENGVGVRPSGLRELSYARDDRGHRPILD